MSRKAETAVLLKKDRFTMSDSWTDRIELTRQPGCKFRVIGSKDLGSPTLDQPGNIVITEADGITAPLRLHREIEETASMLDVELEWVDAIPLIAELDWMTAAVIAKEIEQDLPELPAYDTIVSQRSARSIRAMGKVTIGAEWGYEMHELVMPFERWLRIVAGEDDRIEKPYIYEGKRFLGVWQFDGKGHLEVEYDDGGQGWGGRLQDLSLIDGPKVDGVDLARLACESRPTGED
jgi:hypothetical protein